MQPTELNFYFEKPCRLKLKSGKEVFGVVWEERDSYEKSSYFFASSDEFKAYKTAQQKNDIATCEKLKININIDDVVGAEILNGILPDKNMFI